MEHQAGKGDEVQTRQDVGQALVVAGQPAAAGGPGEAALDHPASLLIGRFSSGIRFLLWRLP